MSAVRGVRTVRRSCSRIEIGCRSRQATFGPSRLHGEEPRSARPGLATPGESIGVAKARRKPGPRWQSRDTGGGLPQIGLRESGPQGAPVDGRHSGQRKPHPLTRMRGNRSSVLRAESGHGQAEREARQRVSEVVRQRRTRSITPRRSGTANSRSPSSVLQRWRAIEWSNGPKLEARRQARSTRGWVTERWAGAAPETGSRPILGSGRRGESPAHGSQTIHGCSCRESVAEVGEEHLPRAIEGSREANREDAM
jgi:hypothetical protein